MSEAVLTIENLRACYKTEMYGISREVKAIENISTEYRRNEVYGIAGESGCGKSTLLKLIAGAVKPPLQVMDGHLVYDFKDVEQFDILNAPEKTINSIRWKNLSYVMQGSMNVLNPLRKIYKSFYDFAFPHMSIGNEKQFKKMVEEHLSKLRLPPEVLSSYPHELSGGMRQRTTIALATICSPDIIIADEPTTALDVVVQRETLNLLKEIQKKHQNTVILVTHDMAVHANIADRIGIMYAGCLVEEAPVKEIFYRPKHPYTYHLVKSLPRIGDKSIKSGLLGAPPNLDDPPKGCRFHPRCPLAQEKCKKEVPPMTNEGDDHRVACFFMMKEGEAS